MNLEQAVRDYLRGDGSLMTLLVHDEEKVNMEWKGADQASRLIVSRVGGSRHGGVPIDRPVLALHCYGSTRKAAADLADAASERMWRTSQADKPLLSASVESTVYLPTLSGVARYVVTTVVTALVPASQA